MRFRSVPAFVLALGSVCLISNGCSSGGNSVSNAPHSPLANAGAAYTGTAGQPVSFSSSGSSDPQGESLTYAWNFGDGGTAAIANPTHTYTAAGTYTVSLTVTDTSNLTSNASTKATITGPPVANAGGPYSGVAGAVIAFSGSGSSDPQGETLTYAWNFGDGASTTGVSPTHAYASAGKYTVSLTVTNSSNLSASATATATVAAAQAPVASAGGPYTGTAGAAIGFNASGSSDPQSEALTYAWNFGDGSTATGVNPSHTYAAAGTYAVSVIVSNAGGMSSTANTTATVGAAAQPPVSDAAGPYVGTMNTPVAFSGSGSSDPQGQTLTYAWNFGDGSSGSGVNASHSYAAAGTYTVTLTVTDTSGLAESATSTATITPAAGAAITGTVATGTAGIAGTRVYLLAAGSMGYGQASVPVLTASLAGNGDAVGGYVVTGSGGSFSVPAGYACSPGEQMYLYAAGGSTGSSANAAIGLLAVIGTCPAVGENVTVNEVSTAAAAYALAGFATDATHVSSSGTALAQVGVANAFANAANLATLSSGVALAATPAGNGTAPQSKLNMVANILASCVHAQTSCGALLATATSDGTAGGVQPGDTATAAINMAHHPEANVAVLYGLAGSVYTPAVSAQPNDFTMVLMFPEGQLADPVRVAIDGYGNVWVANASGVQPDQYGSVVKLSSLGAVLSGANGFIGVAHGMFAPYGIAIDAAGSAWITNGGSGITEPLGTTDPGGIVKLSSSGAFLSASRYGGGGILEPMDIAIDASGNAWIAGYFGDGVLELSSTGEDLSGANGFAFPVNFPEGIAVDGTGDVWVTTGPGANVIKLSSTGTVLSGSSGFTGGGLYGPWGIAIDAAGDAWVANANDSVTEFSSSGVALSAANGFTGGGLNKVSAIAVDGDGDVWAGNGDTGTISELSNAGVPISPATGYIIPSNTGYGNSPYGIAVDGSGNVWATADIPACIVEFVGAAAPVVTPLTVGVAKNMLGTRP